MRNNTEQQLYDIANLLRIYSVESTTTAGSGHPSTCASMAEIIAVLFFNEMNLGVNKPKSVLNDRFVLSKGHAAPILYAAYSQAGLFPHSELNNLRKIDSDLEGHPVVNLPFVDVATGSLGQGLGIACGMAWIGKYLDMQPYRVYCVLGDGECAEGSVWEALNFASHYKLDNLVGIIDINRLGQSEATMFQHDMVGYAKKVEAFGCHPIVVDGHNVKYLQDAFNEARSIKDKPSILLARTYKGRNLKGIEDKDGWHGRPLKRTEANDVIANLKSLIHSTEFSIKPKDGHDFPLVEITECECKLDNFSAPSYSLGDKVATRMAYGIALAKLTALNNRIIALDGDTKNSTFAIKVHDAFPNQFIECFIAEQNLVSVAVGLQCRNRAIPFISGFACFLSRAHDQIRMAAISKANLKFCGSHAGISIGEDGGSQMGLEDISMFRCIPNSTVFYPSDAVSTERAVELAAQTFGICYIRTGRPNTPVIYKNDEVFSVGKAKVVRESPNDVCTVVAAGITLFEALKACDALTQCGKPVRIIDPFTVKPIDKLTIISNAQQTHNRIIVVEDHYAEGGLGEAVLSAIADQTNFNVILMAVNRLPRSGKCEELLHMFQIDAEAIIAKVEYICH